MSREKLAAEGHEFVHDSVRYRLTWDVPSDVAIVTINGVDCHNLDKFARLNEVCHSMTKSIRNRRTYSEIFVLYYGKQCVVAQATHDFRTRKTELCVGRKHKTIVKGKALTDTELFPITLVYDGLEDSKPWKLQLGYNCAATKFTLAVDGLDFFNLAYQSSGEPDGP